MPLMIPATMGQSWGEFVSMRTHPLTPYLSYTPTLPYLWVHAGIRAIPARVYYLGTLMSVPIQSAATSENQMARRPGDE